VVEGGVGRGKEGKGVATPAQDLRRGGNIQDVGEAFANKKGDQNWKKKAAAPNVRSRKSRAKDGGKIPEIK